MAADASPFLAELHIKAHRQASFQWHSIMNRRNQLGITPRHLTFPPLNYVATRGRHKDKLAWTNPWPSRTLITDLLREWSVERRLENELYMKNLRGWSLPHFAYISPEAMSQGKVLRWTLD